MSQSSDDATAADGSRLAVNELAEHPLWIGNADGLLIVDPSGAVVAANPSFSKLFGYAPDEVTALSVESLVPEAFRGAHQALRDGYVAAPQIRNMGASRLLEAQRQDGNRFPVNVSLSPLEADGVTYTLAAVRDLTARIAVEQDRANEQRLRAIADDHDRIARDLHDSVIQHLFAIGLRLQGIPARVDDPTVQRAVEESVDEIDVVIARIRSTIHGLRATEVPDRPQTVQGKILDVIGQMAESLPSSPSVTFEGSVDGITDPALIENLLPTIREALSNVAKHAQASAVSVVIAAGEDLVLLVTDNGRGMADDPERSGLANLEARATGLGGTMRTWQNEPSGVRLEWRVPIHG